MPVSRHAVESGSCAPSLRAGRRCRPRGTGRSLLAPAAAARRDEPNHRRPGGRLTPPAPLGPAHRQDRRRLARHGQPHPHAGRPEPPDGPRFQRARAALRTPAPGRADPYRHQEARPLPSRRPRHHRRPHKAEQSTRAGTGSGWEFVHVCIDDASRIAFTGLMPDEKAVSAVAFLKAASAYYQSLGVRLTRVMTDNGPCYKASAFARTCKRLGLKHIRTKPYTPKTNGKAERFIQTALREWAYARPYNTSDERARFLLPWTHAYNWHRPPCSLKGKTPISRLGASEDNLLRLHI